MGVSSFRRVRFSLRARCSVDMLGGMPDSDANARARDASSVLGPFLVPISRHALWHPLKPHQPKHPEEYAFIETLESSVHLIFNSFFLFGWQLHWAIVSETTFCDAQINASMNQARICVGHVLHYSQFVTYILAASIFG